MVAIAIFTVQMRPWAASEELALPSGGWVADGLVVGDATGGEMILQFNFQNSADPLSARLFSLEQFMLITDALAAVVTGWELQTSNLESFERAAILPRAWGIDMDRIRPNAAGGSARLTNMQGLPIFLGAPVVGNAPAFISFVSDNVNLIVMRAFVQGYFWGPGASTAPGGPQRPLRSVYGN